MTTVAIAQPCYLPWAGALDRVDAVDIFISLDCVQFERGSFINRNRIRTKSGSTMLTVPVKRPITTLDKQAIDFEYEARNHRVAISQAYQAAPYYDQFQPAIEDVYNAPFETLESLNHWTNRSLLNVFDIKTPVYKASWMKPQGTKSDLVLNLCRKAEADTYLSGPFGRNYLDKEAFKRAGIKILFHDYKPVEYKQRYPGFEPAMSAIDILFNHGPEKGLEIIRAGRVVSPG